MVRSPSESFVDPSPGPPPASIPAPGPPPTVRPSLPDRVYFAGQLAAAIAHRSAVGGEVAVAAIAVEQLKEINRLLGYSCGDEALYEVARRLQACLHRSDAMARFVGNEFVVLSRGREAASTLASLTSRLAARLESPIALSGRQVTVSISVGIAATPTTEPDQLIAGAHVALHQAKRGGGGHTVLLDGAQHQADEEQRNLLFGLTEALSRNELHLHYQPVIHLPTGQVSGAEALLRWARPDTGLLPAERFIGLSEESGLMSEIGAWTIAEACRQAARCAAAGMGTASRPFTIAVNVSAHQLRSPGLVEGVRSSLAAAGADPRALALEVTETAAMQNPDGCIRVLTQLRDLGLTLAIDDFGTGFATLTYLRRLPVQIVKIDRSFIEGMQADARDAAIVRGTIDLARALHLTIVAEGVESAAQDAELGRFGGLYAQGYYYSHPVPGDVLADASDHSTWAWKSTRATFLLPTASATRIANLPGDTLLIPATGQVDTPAAVSAATRALLRVSEPAQVPLVLTAAARALGGRVLPAMDAAFDALPADLSFGEGPPLVVEAEEDTPARMLLMRWLPQLLEDARVVIERLREHHRSAADFRTDPLTGLLNRHALDRLLPRLAAPGAVTVLNLDHFKAVNDRYGHDTGDQVLRAFAMALTSGVRAGDSVCRIDGETFVIVLIQTTAAAATALLGRLRTHWERIRPLPVSFSAGVAVVVDTPQAAVVAAEAALYRAKAAGRDQIILSGTA